MSKVSIVIPIYNVEKYLDRCIESIKSQTYTDLEIILIDDGSKDSSGAICDEHAKYDNRIKVIHKENGGVSAARNTGLSVADGEYIMFVDSDDYIDSNMIEEMVLHLPADIVICGLRWVQPEGKIIRENSFDKNETVQITEFIERYFDIAQDGYIISGPYNKLFCKQIINEYNLKFDENLSIGEDWLFVIKYMQCIENVCIMNNAYYNYVQYANNTLMSKYNDNAFEMCELLYNAEIDLTSKSDQYDSSFLIERFMALYFTFVWQIYTRSKMVGINKYKKLKYVLKNEFFCMLILKSKKTNYWCKMCSIAVETNCIWFIHFAYSIKYIIHTVVRFIYRLIPNNIRRLIKEKMLWKKR